jgi:hypothetical protein
MTKSEMSRIAKTLTIYDPSKHCYKKNLKETQLEHFETENVHNRQANNRIKNPPFEQRIQK